MKKGIFVVGTDTGVGKTVVAAGLAMALRAHGIRTGVMKPIATGCRSVGNSLVSDDAVFLMEAAENQYAVLTNPVRFREPLAPSVAAEIEGRSINMQQVFFAYRELTRNYEFVIVEGIGGLLVPLTGHYSMAHLIRDLHLSVLIVGRIGLGTLNHTLLTVEALKARGIVIDGIILNGLDPHRSSLAELTNPKAIETLTGVPIRGVLPRIDMLSVEQCVFGSLQEVFEKNITFMPLLHEERYTNV